MPNLTELILKKGCFVGQENTARINLKTNYQKDYCLLK